MNDENDTSNREPKKPFSFMHPPLVGVGERWMRDRMAECRSGATLFGGDAAALKREHNGEIVIMGSGELIRSLMAEDAIDEYLLMTHPLVLGQGRRLFAPGSAARLRLVESEAAATGVVMSTYRPA